MDHADTALEMPVGRHVLVICARGAVVDETQSLIMGEMHVEQALIGSVKAYSSLRQSQQGVVVCHIRVQHHHPRVEAVWPADIWDSGKVGVHCQELIRSSQGDHICIEVDYSLVLCLLP